ncbi:MAG: dTMP kinase [Tatlockia sp.]|nr:dTMP kinase [Tatlockia sp.]
MTKLGHYIVVEGLEGAGKSTAIEVIKRYLINVAPELILTREPGGTRIGETIRQLLKEKIDGEKLDPRCELLLLYSARVQLIEEVILPALNRGAWVLADRFELSSFAYQGWGRGLDLKMINQLSEFCLQALKPDLIIYLDINPEAGLNRVKNRGETDRIEEETLSFFLRVRQGYQQMIKSMPNVITIDAAQPMDSVQDSILIQLKNYIATNAST